MQIAPGFEDHERAAIAALYWEAFGAKLGRILGPAPKAMRLLSRALRPDHALCARDMAGQILGVAGFKTYQGALVDADFTLMTGVYGPFGALWRAFALTLLQRDVEDRRFLLDGLCVADHARGQGVGSRLLEAIAQLAAQRGYAELRLDVVDSNTRARALYERRGFSAVQTQRMGWLAPLFGFASATVMVRRLS